METTSQRLEEDESWRNDATAPTIRATAGAAGCTANGFGAGMSNGKAAWVVGRMQDDLSFRIWLTLSGSPTYGQENRRSLLVWDHAIQNGRLLHSDSGVQIVKRFGRGDEAFEPSP